MVDKKDSNNITKRPCNVLSTFLTLQNAQSLKIVITPQSYRAVWTPVAEGQSLGTFEFYWTAESVQRL